jgi:hypothetical protein
MKRADPGTPPAYGDSRLADMLEQATRQMALIAGLEQ